MWVSLIGGGGTPARWYSCAAYGQVILLPELLPKDARPLEWGIFIIFDRLVDAMLIDYDAP